MILISDLHGCYGTMVRLLNQCAKLHPGEKLVFLGDLIDRGPHSRAVVEFAMEHKIPTCKGNHEDLCLAFSHHSRRGYKAQCATYYERDIWLYNGGDYALGNWPSTHPKGYRDGEEIPKDVLDWMQALPPYIIPDASLDDKGRKLLLSHTGYGLAADDGYWINALWGRHSHGEGEFPEDNYYRVFGHTRVSPAEITDTWANIDTGGAYGGGLTAFLWPSKETLYQPFDEKPCEPIFCVRFGRLYDLGSSVQASADQGPTGPSSSDRI